MDSASAAQTQAAGRAPTTDGLVFHSNVGAGKIGFRIIKIAPPESKELRGPWRLPITRTSVGDAVSFVEGARLTPIPFDEAVTSLSAILLDDEYYAFMVNGRRNIDGLPWIGAEQLIPMSA